MSQRQQQQSAAPATTTQTTTQTSPAQQPTTQAPRTLRLRGRHTSTGRSVQWAEDVVDNEGLGRKSSKGTPPSLLPATPSFTDRVQSAASTTGPRPSVNLATSPPRIPQIPNPTPTLTRIERAAKATTPTTTPVTTDTAVPPRRARSRSGRRVQTPTKRSPSRSPRTRLLLPNHRRGGVIDKVVGTTWGGIVIQSKRAF
jgi:hypothetical protein